VTPQPKPPAKLFPGALDSLQRLIESTAAREGMSTTEAAPANDESEDPRDTMGASACSDGSRMEDDEVEPNEGDGAMGETAESALAQTAQPIFAKATVAATGEEISKGDGKGKDVNAAMQSGRGDGKGKDVSAAPQSGKGGGTGKDVNVALQNGKGDGKYGNAYHVVPRPSAAGDLPDTVVKANNGDVQLAPEVLKKLEDEEKAEWVMVNSNTHRNDNMVFSRQTNEKKKRPSEVPEHLIDKLKNNKTELFHAWCNSDKDWGNVSVHYKRIRIREIRSKMKYGFRHRAQLATTRGDGEQGAQRSEKVIADKLAR
ncbi:unnamed protein product, partial [Prorocentrum cordatum]